MDKDFYCSLCRVDCIDGTGMLLHVLSEKHCIAYQSKMRSRSQSRSASDESNSKTSNSVNRRELDMFKNNEAEPISVKNVKSETSLMENNVSADNTQPNLAKSMKNDLFCRLCGVDFADDTDKLHHMLSENHCMAYEKKVRSQKGNASKYRDYSKKHISHNNRSECHQIKRNSVRGNMLYNKINDNYDEDISSELSDVMPAQNFNSSKEPSLKYFQCDACFSVKQKEVQQVLGDELNKEFWKKLQLGGCNHDICYSEVKSKNKRSKKRQKNKKITEDSNKNINLKSVKMVSGYISTYSNEGINPNNIVSKKEKSNINKYSTENESYYAIRLKDEPNLYKETIENNCLKDSFMEEKNEDPHSEGLISKKKRKKIRGYFSRMTIKGFPANVDAMLVKKYFCNYGNIKLFEVIGYVFCVEYFERSALDKIFIGQHQTKLSINGQNVEVKENIFRSNKDYRVGNLPNDMKIMFSSREFFKKKFDELLSNIDLGPDEIEKQNSVCSSVVECLKLDFEPSAYTFGSRVTGLATKNSDLDIYLDIKCPAEFLETKHEHSTQESIVLCASRRLCTCADFESVFAIINARTPIVQFLHKPTGIKCDLSFQAPFGLFNTAFNKYLLSLDYRVKPLMVFIRYWSSAHGLVRKGRLSNYCLMLMVIFYLQQLPLNPILPTVAFLMKLANESEKRTIGSWECGFSKNVSLIPKSTNKSTVFQLLSGFFKFYSEFDFDNFVICPFLGEAINKKCFLPGMESELPQDFVRYVSSCKENITKPLDVNCILCVQDPFVHNHNTARQNGKTISQNFKTYSGLYADVCDSVDKIEDFSTICESIYQNKIKY